MLVSTNTGLKMYIHVHRYKVRQFRPVIVFNQVLQILYTILFLCAISSIFLTCADSYVMVLVSV